VSAPSSTTSVVSRPAPFHLLLCAALVLYVYRVFVVGANLSVFRLVLAGWTIVALVDLARRRTPLSRWHAALAGLAAAIVLLNAADFAGLAAHPDLRRDILNHLLNVWFTVLVALHLRSHAAVISLLAAFVWSSVLTSAITLATWVLGALPFEGWLRAYGGPAAKGLRYIGYDLYFHRATSAFFDPNFYGIYTALVIITALGLWILVERRRALLWLVAVNLIFLSASLSRTGFVGLLGGLAVAFVTYRQVAPDPHAWQARPDRHGAASGRRVVGATAVAACVCFFAGSVVQSRAERARLAAWWSADPATVSAEDRLAAAYRAGMTIPPDQDRLTGSASVADRFRRIRHGWNVFRSAPWLGGGGGALLRPDFPPHASAHLVYLTLLARYGIVGTLVYAAFALVPLVGIVRRRGPPADPILVTVAACLSLIFLSYDVFLGFEIHYLFFGMAWALAALPAGGLDGDASERPPAVSRT
jgi:hypothetical protein